MCFLEFMIFLAQVGSFILIHYYLYFFQVTVVLVSECVMRCHFSLLICRNYIHILQCFFGWSSWSSNVFLVSHFGFQMCFSLVNLDHKLQIKTQNGDAFAILIYAGTI